MNLATVLKVIEDAWELSNHGEFDVDDYVIEIAVARNLTNQETDVAIAMLVAFDNAYTKYVDAYLSEDEMDKAN